MKKDFNLTKLFYSFAIAFSVVTLSSCNNDDNSPLPPPSTNDVAGTYNGKVLITQVTPATAKENAGEAPQGQDVNATVKNDTVFFDKLPVTELITSIVGDKDKAVQREPGSGDPQCAGREGYVRADAYGRREIPLLSASGHAHGGRGDRHFPPDRADEEPGGRHAHLLGRVGNRPFPQFVAQQDGRRAGACRRAGREDETALFRPRIADHTFQVLLPLMVV